MLRIALTGGIATGKSYVRARLEWLGVPCVDADRLARQVVAPGTLTLAAIADRFGASVLDEGGSLDRQRLASVVFSDERARRDLEALIHPAVYDAIAVWLQQHAQAGAPLAVADIPLLYETGRESAFDVVVVTACPPEEQVRRVQARDGATAEDARRRIAAQWPIEDKVRRADFVIRTDGTFDATDAQVEALYRALLVRAGRA